MPYECYPTLVPEDDPFYKQFGITCLDGTRSVDSKILNCNDVKPVIAMNYQTSPADLSFVYGANEQQNHQIRAYSKGLLKTNKTNDGYFVFPAYVESCPFGGINPTAGSPCYAYGITAATNYGVIPKSTGYNNAYNEKCNLATWLETSSTSARHGHSNVRGDFQHGITAAKCIKYRLAQKYFGLGFITECKNGFTELTKMYTVNQCQKQDNWMVDDLTNKLFAPPSGKVGSDLISTDIGRGREYGQPGYNEYRKKCGLPIVQTWSDFANITMDTTVLPALKELYYDPGSADLYTMALLEKPCGDSSLGPTFTCMLGAQYYEMIRCDRLWYDCPSAKFTMRKTRCPDFDKRVEGQSFSGQNAADAACAKPFKRCDRNDIHYTMDGSCNNIDIPSWAQAGTPYVRLLAANYSDGISKFRKSIDGSPLPSARVIRSTLILDKPTPSKGLNIFFYAFGQFVDHDVTLSRMIESSEPCCINHKPVPNLSDDVCMPLIIPENDSFYSKFGVTCIDFKRMQNTKLEGCNVKPIFQINSQTGVMDMSVTYGISDAEVRTLRTGSGGLLKVTNDHRTSNQEYPLIISGPICPFGGVHRKPQGDCFIAGDERVNQNPELLICNVIFLKLHNLIARHLQSINPHWDDERLFKVARRISIALYQHVITSEYIPVLIGPRTAALYKLLPATSGYIRGYDTNLNPQTLVSYAAGAGRGGHSNIVGTMNYKGPDEENESYLLRHKYFNNSFLLRKNMYSNILDAYIKQPCDRQDNFFTDEVNNWMLHTLEEPFGFDLPAVDILRGRDYGLPTYNQFREACGLCRLHTFEELANDIINPEDIKKLKTLYKSVDDIDYYVGGLMEKPLPDATLGQSFACIQAESFFRWKFGDRLFYEFQQTKFTHAQLNTIRKVTMSKIICLTHPWLKSTQKNSFLIESSQNPQVHCSDLPKIDLDLWKEK
ncbi:hypothetical protein V9T40_012372 [Parthenolecanium corni]|uniref:Peroxidase n=1 Tax=Parthenolecanium corni TaxID=536013 RepID=A0AAN9T8R6_9HEMI